MFPSDLGTVKTVLAGVLVLIFSLLWLWNYLRRWYYISKVPGPTAYPLIGTMHLMWGGNGKEISKMFLDNIKKFRPTWRLWFGIHPAVFISDPEDIKTILRHPDALDKSWLMTHFGKYCFGDSILVSKVEKWKRHRKIVNTGMTQPILNGFIPQFAHEAKVLVQQLEKEVDQQKPFNVYNYTTRATLDAVTGSAIGVHMNSQQMQNSLYFLGVTRGLQLLFLRVYNLLVFPNLIYKLTQFGKEIEDLRSVVYKFTDKVIQTKKMQMGGIDVASYPPDVGIHKNPLQKPLLEFLLDMKENDALTHEEVRDETNIMITGGYETSATTMSYILLSLAMNPEVQRKAYEEVKSVLAETNGEITERTLQNFKYLDLVIKESLRLFPTVPYILREISKDIQLNNYMLPKGSSCVIMIIGAHRDEKSWEKPNEFIPERFLPREHDQRHPYSYIPFSGGPRNCVGARYASLILKVMIATLLNEYEFSTPLEFDKMEYNMELTLKCVGGYLLNIKKRCKN